MHFLAQCCGSSTNSKLKILDHAFVSLSPEEQEKAIRELYGDEEEFDESDEFVEGKLKELDQEVNKLSEATKCFYLDALAIEKQQGAEKYVSSRKFRLMFLRAERFDSRKAAMRITRYFQEKMELFGTEKLARRIRQSDLSNSDLAALTNGFLCAFQSYDSAGRLVFVFRRRLILAHDITSTMRAIFYSMQITMENNEQAQKKGVIFIAYNLGLQVAVNASFIRKFVKVPKMFFYALPYRIAAHHMFYNDIKDSIKANIIAVTYPKEVRSRVHRHFVNTHEEFMWKLPSFGIDPNLIPFTENGECRKDELLHWVEKQSESERESWVGEESETEKSIEGNEEYELQRETKRKREQDKDGLNSSAKKSLF